MSAPALLSGGRIFFRGEFVEKDILIEDGRIARIGVRLPFEGKPISASGLLVLPGLIDPHVHLREPGAEKKEDFRTGTEAALAGGFTTVMDMPNNPLPTTTAARYAEKKALAAKKALCRVLFHFGATDTNFAEVAKADPGSLKIYMGHTTGELMLKESGSLERHLSGFGREMQVVVHASDDSQDEKANLERTYANERLAIGIAKKLNRKIHLAHASTAEEIPIWKAFPGASCEAAPHYLFLSRKDAERLGVRGTVYPPLRSEALRKALWDALPQIDCIATDHAPHTLEDKEAGARGFPGLETSLALMLDAHHRRLIPLGRAVAMMCEKPADIFGLKGLGRIEEGAAADLALVDLREEWEVRGEELFTKCKWSPFEGKKLKGRVKKTIYGGEIRYDGGEILA